LRRAEGKTDGFASALKSLNASVDNISEFVQTTEKELKAAEDTNDDDKKIELFDFLTLFRGTLASRLSTYGDCLREAGQYEEALEVLTRSYDMNSNVDNLKGMIQALGNKGLVYVDLENFHEAESCFKVALDMADNQFATQKDEKTLSSVQQASMNIGLFYYKFAQQTLVGTDDTPPMGIESQDVAAQRLLEMALNKLYITLVISDRIPMHVKSTCVVTLREIYGKYHGDIGAIACNKLDQMFPDVAKSGGNLNINFLIDVSPSMSGKRIKSCEQTLMNIVNGKMKDRDMITVNIFAADYDQLILPTSLSSANRGDVIATLQTLRFRTNKGRTYFYSALSRMANELATANGTDTEQWIVALTDGEDNERGSTYESAKQMCLKLNIKIILISVGLETPHVLKILKYLASEEKYFIKSTDDPDAITDALGKGFEMAASGNVMMESL
jgi:Mg-chelatase subunit ChlD